MGYAKDLHKIKKADEALHILTKSTPAYCMDFVNITSGLDLRPHEDIDQLLHANKCLDPRELQEDSLIPCWSTSSLPEVHLGQVWTTTSLLDC